MEENKVHDWKEERQDKCETVEGREFKQYSYIHYLIIEFLGSVGQE